MRPPPPADSPPPASWATRLGDRLALLVPLAALPAAWSFGPAVWERAALGWLVLGVLATALLLRWYLREFVADRPAEPRAAWSPAWPLGLLFGWLLLQPLAAEHRWAAIEPLCTAACWLWCVTGLARVFEDRLARTAGAATLVAAALIAAAGCWWDALLGAPAAVVAASPAFGPPPAAASAAALVLLFGLGLGAAAARGIDRRRRGAALAAVAVAAATLVLVGAAAAWGAAAVAALGALRGRFPRGAARWAAPALALGVVALFAARPAWLVDADLTPAAAAAAARWERVQARVTDPDDLRTLIVGRGLGAVAVEAAEWDEFETPAAPRWRLSLDGGFWTAWYELGALGLLLCALLLRSFARGSAALARAAAERAGSVSDGPPGEGTVRRGSGEASMPRAAGHACASAHAPGPALGPGLNAALWGWWALALASGALEDGFVLCLSAVAAGLWYQQARQAAGLAGETGAEADEAADDASAAPFHPQKNDRRLGRVGLAGVAVVIAGFGYGVWRPWYELRREAALLARGTPAWDEARAERWRRLLPGAADSRVPAPSAAAVCLAVALAPEAADVLGADAHRAAVTALRGAAEPAGLRLLQIVQPGRMPATGPALRLLGDHLAALEDLAARTPGLIAEASALDYWYEALRRDPFQPALFRRFAARLWHPDQPQRWPLGLPPGRGVLRLLDTACARDAAHADDYALAGFEVALRWKWYVLLKVHAAGAEVARFDPAQHAAADVELARRRDHVAHRWAPADPPARAVIARAVADWHAEFAAGRHAGIDDTAVRELAERLGVAPADR